MTEVALIFPTLPDGTILLQLRDNKPDIVYPGKVGIFGGEIEGSESPEQAVVREAQEELELDVQINKLKFQFSIDIKADSGRGPEHRYHVFLYPCADATGLCLHEGQEIIFLKPTQNMYELDLAYPARIILGKLREI